MIAASLDLRLPPIPVCRHRRASWWGLGVVGLTVLLLCFAAPGVATKETASDPRLERLTPRHRDWLESVAILISDLEREAFLELARDYQRTAFIRRFWNERDPFPDSSRNELEDRWEENLGLARDHFEDLGDARAGAMLLHGEPASILEGRCPGVLKPVEVWRYGGSDLIQGAFVLAFYQPMGNRGGRFEGWDATLGLDTLFTFGTISDDPRALQIRIADECIRGDELLGGVLAAASIERLAEVLDPILHPNPEWVGAFQARNTELPDGARPLTADLELHYPRRHQSRTVVQGLVTVPRDAATPGGSAERPSYSFLLDGEILRRGELFDSFRYRFDLPEDHLAAGAIPLLVERFLRPGPYQLILKVEDLYGERFYRQELEVEVPLLPSAAATQYFAGLNLGPTPDDEERLPDEVVVQIQPVASELTTGLVRIHARVTGPDVARVRFELDGEPVLSKARAPYTVELDVGRAPQLHTVRAVAEDARRRPLAEDEIAINAGPHRLAVRLVEPRANRLDRSQLRAHAVVEVPEGERLDRLELYLDDTLIATLYQPPFVQPLPAPDGAEISYVRAVAHLAEGGSAEDVAFLFAPGELDELDVQLVELYTTVVNRRGRPVVDLSRDEFKIFEDEIEQELLRFEWVENLPVHAGVLLDTSTSMIAVMDQAKQAALGFFEQLLTPRDRASVITFSGDPELRVRFTNRLEVLAGGLADVYAEGETALYDSLIYTLYYFSGIQGKRLLVLISDGEDSASEYSYEEVLDFARRAGVSIFTIGLSLPADNHTARRALQGLASETGGTCYLIDSVREMHSVYTKIERDLRSQYLLAYQSSQGDSDPDHYRRIVVKVDRSGLSARTLRGYFP